MKKHRYHRLNVFSHSRKAELCSEVESLRNPKTHSAVAIFKFIFIIIFFTLHFTLSTLHYVRAGAGKTGAEFLLIAAGARPAAMGGAYVAIADDISAVYWNPAGLASLRGRGISATHAEWLSGIRYESLGYGHSVGKLGTIGISAFYLHTGDMVGRSLSGKKTDDFTAYDLVTNLSFGSRINNNISLGTTVKLIKQSIEDEDAVSMAFDLGGLYEIGHTRLVLGAALLNLGPGMKFVKEEYQLPLTLNLGIGYRLDMAVFALDIKHRLNEKNTSFSIGTEYRPMSFLAFRGGYLIKTVQSLRLKKESVGDLSGLGGGIGFKLNRYQLDYAFVPSAGLGSTHRISFAGKF